MQECSELLHAFSRAMCAPPSQLYRYLPWAANSDARFVSVPERLQSAPLHQQQRDSDFVLPLPLVRGLFAQALHLSACWSTAVPRPVDDTAEQRSGSAMRGEAQCDEDEALYHSFDENRWPKLERRWAEQRVAARLPRVMTRSATGTTITRCASG
jgi:hypothetical protein